MSENGKGIALIVAALFILWYLIQTGVETNQRIESARSSGYDYGFREGVESDSAKDYWHEEIYNKGYSDAMLECKSYAETAYKIGFEDGSQQ